MTRRNLWSFALAFAAAYFAAAYWLKVAYDPRGYEFIPKVAGTKILLRPPFREFLDSGFAAVSTDHLFGDLADTADNNFRSPIQLYEDDKPLGPAHSVHADIGKIGHGRYSHWRYNYSIFLFSSSDNTDPRTNGRNYWAIKPGAP
jgi:hypothetical protein